MKQIRAFIQVLVYATIFSFMISCGDDEIEIVSQDTEWTMDNKYIEEDIREQLGIDPYKNFIYLGYADDPFYTLQAVSDLQHVTLEGESDFKVKVRLTKAYDKDLTLKLVRVENLENEFPGKIEDYIAMAENNCTLDTKVLKAGAKEMIMSFGLKNIEELSKAPGYALTLKLELEGEHEDIFVSAVRSKIFMKMNVTIRLDNIDSSNQVVEGELLDNREVVFDSNENTSTLYRINDGSISTYWPSKSGAFLNMTFLEEVVLKAIKVDTSVGGWGSPFGRATILVDHGDGIWVEHGKFQLATANKIVYVAFKTPMKCVRVRFESMQTVTRGNAPDFCEVNFIK